MLLEIDEHKIVPDFTKSIEDGAIAIWKEGAENWRIRQIYTLAKHFKFSMATPWKDLPKKTRDAILFGTGDEEITFVYDDGLRTYKTKKAFEGVIGTVRVSMTSSGRWRPRRRCAKRHNNA